MSEPPGDEFEPPSSPNGLGGTRSGGEESAGESLIGALKKSVQEIEKASEIGPDKNELDDITSANAPDMAIRNASPFDQKNREKSFIERPGRKPRQRAEENFIQRIFTRIPAGLWGLLIFALLIAFLMGGLAAIAQKNLARSSEKILRIAPDQSVSYGFQDLQGVWVNSTPQYWMYFKVNENKYEWVIQFPETPGLRYFSRGDLVLANDVMVATQRGALGTPVDPERLYIGYMPISLININIRLKLSEGAMMWEVEPQESKRLEGPVSVLFNPHAAQNFNWTKAR
ncbi:MAG: hypothetical protein JNK24_05045 [Alphaproteobacteria bacterium]|nr:hypothetical protein [Alphaproteobacteria bacterium]